MSNQTKFQILKFFEGLLLQIQISIKIYITLNNLIEFITIHKLL